MSVNREMAKGAVWTVGLRMFDRAIGFLSTLILVRLLLPEDFGLVAMATVFMHLLFAISDFSVHVPLIQKPEIDREDMDGAWTLQCLVGLIQGGLLLAIAHPVSAFYGEPRLLSVIYTLAAIASIGGARNIGVVMFQREMQFNRDFMLRASQRMVGFVVTLVLAVVWKSYWALLIGMLVNTSAGLLLTYVLHPFRPRVSVARWSELIGFSKWMLLTNIFAFIGTRAPDFFLGRLFGPRSVGLYSVSYEIAMLPSTELVAPINRVALPGYSRMLRTDRGLQRGFLDVIGLIALIAVPAAVGIASIADLLVPTLLGKNWLDATPVIRYLAIAGAIGALTTNTHSIVLALGRPALLAFAQAIRMIVFVPGLYFGALYDGVAGVAVAYILAISLMLFIYLGITLKLLALSLGRYVQVIYRPIASATLMYVLESSVVVPWLTQSMPNAIFLNAILAVIIGAAVFIAIEVSLWLLAGRPPGAEGRVLQLLSEALQRKVPSVSAWLERQRPGTS